MVNYLKLKDITIQCFMMAKKFGIMKLIMTIFD